MKQWKAAVKRARWRGKNTVDESWLMELFDICSCKCVITEKRVFRSKAIYSFEFECGVYSLEAKFILPRSERKMIAGWFKDKHFEKIVHETLKRKRISTAGE